MACKGVCGRFEKNVEQHWCRTCGGYVDYNTKNYCLCCGSKTRLKPRSRFGKQQLQKKLWMREQRRK